MLNEQGQVNNTPRSRARLENGLDVLDRWAETASQARKNAVYAALFAMQDGSMFQSYRVIDDFERLNEVFVIVKDDLAMKIRLNSFDSFAIVAIGPCGSATDLQSGRWSGE